MGSMSLLSSSTSLTLDQLDLVRISQTCGEQLLVVIDDILGILYIFLHILIFTRLYENGRE